MGEKCFIVISDKYEIPTLNSVVYICRLHVDNMFDEMPVLASRDLVMILFSLFLLHNCFPVFLLILIYHSILSNGLSSGPEKVA